MMMNSGLLLRLLMAVVIGVSDVTSRNFHFTNNCPYTVWVGALNNGGFELPANGGWQMDSGASRDVGVQDNWQGRFWGRTSCDGGGHCETGDCGNKIECAGAGGVPPATLAEFTLQGDGGKDFYDVSLVDGFNLPIAVTPKDGQGDCQTSDCPANVNDACPDDLKQVVNGNTVACLSACAKYPDRQDYCCSGPYNNPQCQPSSYASTFRQQCPKAYSYAYDDQKGTFTCTGANYDITFCP